MNGQKEQAKKSLIDSQKWLMVLSFKYLVYGLREPQL